MIFTKRALIKDLGFFLILITLLFLSHKLNESVKKPYFFVSKQESAYNFNDDTIRLMSAGNHRLLASLVWVDTLLESDLDHYKKRDFNSWMYLRFRSIVMADPKFYEVYLYGGQYLSIIKDDIVGADDIYERGLKFYPKDFWLNYHMGFNSYFELGKTDQALKHYERILNDPLVAQVIPYLPSLVAKLKIEKGNLEAAFSLLEAAYKKTKDEKLRVKYSETLYALRAQIDLECLNFNKGPCRKEDWENEPYILDSEGKYQSKKAWKPIKIRRK